MHSIEEARDAALALVRPMATERVTVPNSRGRTLREPIMAAFDVPCAPTSMMDGYAIVAAGPATRRVVQGSAAGAPSMRPLELDEAAPISTGALLPPGADAVVPFEDTTRDELVRLLVAVRPAQFVRMPGSDLRANEPLSRRASSSRRPRLRFSPGRAASTWRSRCGRAWRYSRSVRSCDGPAMCSRPARSTTRTARHSWPPARAWASKPRSRHGARQPR